MGDPTLRASGMETWTNFYSTRNRFFRIHSRQYHNRPVSFDAGCNGPRDSRSDFFGQFIVVLITGCETHQCNGSGHDGTAKGNVKLSSRPLDATATVRGAL